jgi:hypothetical protein
MKTIIFSLLILSCLSCGNYSRSNANSESKNGQTQSASNKNVFNKKDYGEKWPFSIEEIEVFCDGNSDVYMRTSQGIYALNGKAVGKVNNSKSDVTDKTFQEIWLDDSTMKGFKITLPPEFIKQGLENCK